MFGITEGVFDPRTRLLVVRGAVRPSRIVGAAEDAAGLRLVLDLTRARLDEFEAGLLADGLLLVRGERGAVVVAPPGLVADAIVERGYDEILLIATSREDARALLAAEDEAATRMRATPVDLCSLTGADRILVVDGDGNAHVTGTSARWETRAYPLNREGETTEGLPWMAFVYPRPASVLALVVFDGEDELAAIDAHLVGGMSFWLEQEFDPDGSVRLAVCVVIFLELSGRELSDVT